MFSKILLLTLLGVAFATNQVCDFFMTPQSDDTSLSWSSSSNQGGWDPLQASRELSGTALVNRIGNATLYSSTWIAKTQYGTSAKLSYYCPIFADFSGGAGFDIQAYIVRNDGSGSLRVYMQDINNNVNEVVTNLDPYLTGHNVFIPINKSAFSNLDLRYVTYVRFTLTSYPVVEINFLQIIPL